jgi:hypothetical protein
VILKDWNKKVKGAQAPTALESLPGSIEETRVSKRSVKVRREGGKVCITLRANAEATCNRDHT